MSQPQAPGFAAALDRLMAQGGKRKNTRKGFVYSQGRLKGLTKDQAVQRGRNMWDGASDAVKNKYAKRQQYLQAPLEKTADSGSASGSASGATGGSSRGGQSSAPRYADGAPSPSFEELTKAPAIPEGGIKVIGNDALEKAFPGIQNSNYTAPEPASKKPLPATSEEAIENAFPGIQEKITQKPKPNIKAEGPPLATTLDNWASMTAAEKLEYAEGDMSQMSGDDRMRLKGQTNLEKGDPRTPRISERDGIPAHQLEAGTPVNKTGVAPRINPLTKLPMGYIPGDALPSSADSGMKTEADASLARQQSASQGAFSGPKTQRQIDESRGIRLPKTQEEKDAEARNTRLKQDPDIFKKDDAAYQRYQNSFGRDGSEYKAAKAGANSAYDNASEIDKARLVGNSMRRAQAEINAATDTSGAPRAKPVPQPDRMSNIASPAPAASASRFRGPISRRR